MITKKVAVPLINEKILQQAVHCYVATAGISDNGFEFLRSRIAPKCKVDIVTGLDEPTSPVVLQKILKNYQGRINLNIYTRNVLHANLYIFDLPFKKSVAFVGSGSLTLDGLKDNEELFWKITDPKEIESLLSWYTTYFQFSVPLSETIATEYEYLYPSIMNRVIASRKEKQEMFALTASSFSWDAIKFRSQYFKKEDYLILANANALFDNASIHLARTALREKLMGLHEQHVSASRFLKLKRDESTPSIDRASYTNGRITEMFIRYYKASSDDLAVFDTGLMQRQFFIRMIIQSGPRFRALREQWSSRLSAETSAQEWFNLLQKSLPEYTIEVAGQRKPVSSFNAPRAVAEFLLEDGLHLFDIVFERRINPGDALLSDESIGETVAKELEKLAQIA
jgi:hypothetical protein